MAPLRLLLLSACGGCLAGIGTLEHFLTITHRYHSDDPLDLGEALWLSHWALPEGEPWAQLVSKARLLCRSTCKCS